MQFIVQSSIVQVLHVLAPGDIIGNFTIFEGLPLNALNAHSFFRESWISVLNASRCCKMISINNDI